MEKVQNLLLEFFENCDALGSISINRLPPEVDEAMNAWRESLIFACTKAEFQSQLLEHWKILGDRKDSEEVMKVLEDELEAVVVIQRAAIEEASSAVDKKLSKSQVWKVRMLEALAARAGSSFVESIKNIMSDLPGWAKITLDLIKEFFDIAFKK